MTEIKLPPLPDDLIAHRMTETEVRSLLKRYGERCATAAIEADRKHFAETLSALSGDAAGMYEQECDSYFNGLSDGYDYAAQVLRGEEKSADRKRRGEPVASANPVLHAQILTLRKYQAWRTGEDTRTMDEAGIVPAAITSALDAVLEIAENHLRGDTKQAEPSGYAYRYRDHSGGAFLRFNNGGEVNGARPIEAVPYWFAPQQNKEKQ